MLEGGCGIKHVDGFDVASWRVWHVEVGVACVIISPGESYC